MSGIKILHHPNASFPKFTIMFDQQVLMVSNKINPSELLELFEIPHVYQITTEMTDESK